MSVGAQPVQTPPDATGGGAFAVCVLLLTAVLSLIWSHVRLLWNDEFLSFYSDSAPSLLRVLEIQLHSPISLDPPTYHLLSHLSMQAIGRNAMALRLPALAGFLLLQSSLFLLVRRLAGHRAALVAMVFPLSTASFRYSVEGRPYGLMLGLYAAAFLCWYLSAERSTNGTSRALPLAGLVIAIALCITSHYFGVLILAPVVAAELARTVQRRRFDWPLAAALVLGLCSVALILPFQKALLPYRQHYYITSVNPHNITQGYREIFLRYNAWSLPMQHVCAALLASATLALLVASVRTFRTGRGKAQDARALWDALWWGLLAFAALPLFGYVLGKYVTHTMEVRYVIAALVAFAVALALVLMQRLRSTAFFTAVFGGLLALSIGAAAVQINAEQHKSATILSALTMPPTLAAELAAHPGERLYTQSLTDLFTNSYYGPEPLVRSRITLLYDKGAEVHWLRHNTNAVTAVYLQRFSPLITVPYGAFLQQPAPLLLFYSTGWEWIGKDLAARGTPRRQMGPALGGELFRVQPAAHSATSEQ